MLKFTERHVVEVKKSDVLVYFCPKLSAVSFNVRLWIGITDKKLSQPQQEAGGVIKYEVVQDVAKSVK